MRVPASPWIRALGLLGLAFCLSMWLVERAGARPSGHPTGLAQGKELPYEELAKAWRTERALRRLEALLAVADKSTSLIVTGNGDVIEPEDNLIAIGSGGPFAQSAARALLDNTELGARDIVEKGLSIAADICIYTNHKRTIEELDCTENV